MKPYEGCAVCAVNELREECDSCVYTLASKEELLSRLLDNVHYTQYEHKLIKEALLKEYDFDYAIRYEGNTLRQLLQLTIDDARKQTNMSQKDAVDMKCDGGNCYKCLFWKPSYLNICENQFFTLASEKELIRRLDANEYENRRDDIIKTLKEQYGYDYETKSIIDLDSGIRFKNNDNSVNMPSKSKIVETIDRLDISNVSNKEELIGLIIINILKLF
jgi:hypothetical protein